jgi:hypothetical protein
MWSWIISLHSSKVFLEELNSCNLLRKDPVSGHLSCLLSSKIYK